MKQPIALLFAIALAPSLLRAQRDHTGYAEHQHREIKALSPEETAALLEGEGAGMALAAELNGYAGPRHVVELADELELTASQWQRTQRIFDSMQEVARELGQEILEGERRLDAHFASGHAEIEVVTELTTDLGRLRGQLRAVHLNAHVEMATVLTPEQRRRYDELRGYSRQRE